MDASSGRNGVDFSAVQRETKEQAELIPNKQGVKSFMGRDVTQVPITRFTAQNKKNPENTKKFIKDFKIEIIKEEITNQIPHKESNYSDVSDTFDYEASVANLLKAIESNRKRAKREQKVTKRHKKHIEAGADNSLKEKQVFLEKRSFLPRINIPKKDVYSVSSHSLAEKKKTVFNKSDALKEDVTVNYFPELTGADRFKTHQKSYNEKKLRETRSKKTVAAQASAKHERKALKLTQQSIRGNLDIPPGSTFIGNANTAGKCVTLPSGINEKIIFLPNKQYVIAHRDGRYIPLVSNEVIKGFENKYYALINDICYGGGQGEVGVIYDGEAHFVPEKDGEKLCQSNNKVFLACVDGQVKEVVKGKPLIGFFDKIYYPRNDGLFETKLIEQHEALQSSIDKLYSVHSPVEARVSLTELFNSPSGKALFTDNDYPVELDSALKFTECYKKAVRLESKETLGLTQNQLSSQAKKKKQRLLAITEVEKFLKSLSPSDPQFKDKCRQSLQLLGRIRERSLVTQKQMPYCGGFSILQTAWGADPLKMTKVSIELMSNKQKSVQLSTMVPGSTTTATISPGFQINKYSEAASDSMLIAALYDLKYMGSYPYEDALKASFLGVPVQRPKFQAKFNSTSKSVSDNSNDLFLDDLCKATKEKVSISATMDGRMYKYFLERLSHEYERKGTKDIINIEPEFSSFNGDFPVGHMVAIDKVKRKVVNGEKFIELKLHTFGAMHYIQLKEKTFLKHFYRDSFNLINADKNKEYKVFKKLDDTGFYNKGVNGCVESIDGKKYTLSKGESVEVRGVVYQYLGGGKWLPPVTKR